MMRTKGSAITNTTAPTLAIHQPLLGCGTAVMSDEAIIGMRVILSNPLEQALGGHPQFSRVDLRGPRWPTQARYQSPARLSATRATRRVSAQGCRGCGSYRPAPPAPRI